MACYRIPNGVVCTPHKGDPEDLLQQYAESFPSVRLDWNAWRAGFGSLYKDAVHRFGFRCVNISIRTFVQRALERGHTVEACAIVQTRLRDLNLIDKPGRPPAQRPERARKPQ